MTAFCSLPEVGRRPRDDWYVQMCVNDVKRGGPEPIGDQDRNYIGPDGTPKDVVPLGVVHQGVMDLLQDFLELMLIIRIQLLVLCAVHLQYLGPKVLCCGIVLHRKPPSNTVKRLHISIIPYFGHFFQFTRIKRQKKSPTTISTNNYKTFKLEQVAGIEPASSAWKAEVLPLNHTCMFLTSTNYKGISSICQ